MPSVVRLNRNQLIEWIESTEAGGGDVTELRSALEASGPDQDSHQVSSVLEGHDGPVWPITKSILRELRTRAGGISFRAVFHDFSFL